MSEPTGQDESTAKQQAADVRAVLKGKIASAFRARLEEKELLESSIVSLLDAIDDKVPTAAQLIEALKEEGADDECH